MIAAGEMLGGGIAREKKSALRFGGWRFGHSREREDIGYHYDVSNVFTLFGSIRGMCIHRQPLRRFGLDDLVELGQLLLKHFAVQKRKCRLRSVLS